MTKLTKIETHEKAVNNSAYTLIENGISTCTGPGRGIDLILDNGKTILVRGMNEEDAVALIGGSIDNLKADYLIVATNQRYTYKRFYILTMNEAKVRAVNNSNKMTDIDNWFIEPGCYQEYREKYSTFV